MSGLGREPSPEWSGHGKFPGTYIGEGEYMGSYTWACPSCGEVIAKEGHTLSDFMHLVKEHQGVHEYYDAIPKEEELKISPSEALDDPDYCYRHTKEFDQHTEKELQFDNEHYNEPIKIEEPDPSNPDREINPEPEIPEPVEGEGDDDHEIQPQPQTVTAEGLDLPDKVEIPERLYNDLMMMIEYSVSNDNEAGGFLIKAKHGELGVVGEQFGKDREIVLEPNEELHEGEELLGTCIRPKTLILGDNQPIDNMTIGSMAFGLTGHNRVIQTMHREYSGNMIQIKASGMLPLETTTEHPILTVWGSQKHKDHKLSFERPQWKAAKDIVPKGKTEGDYLIIPRLIGKDETTSLSLAPFIKGNEWSIRTNSIALTEEFAWLLGLYVAEGYSRGFNRGFGFALNKDEENLVERLEKTLKSKVTVRNVSSRGIRIESYWSVLGRALKMWCGSNAHSKQIPDFILYHKNEAILKAFLKGYETGDGYKTVNGISITTVSPILAQQYQLAWARLGFVTSITSRKREGNIFQNRLIKGSIEYNVNRSSIISRYSHSKVTNKAIFVPVRQTSVSPFNGKVFNIETTDNTYLVSNAVVHNCHMHPITPTASTGDVSGYMRDHDEKIMVVVGADKSINFFFKVPNIAAEGDYGDEISDNFEQSDMDLLAEGLGFIWYRGEESDGTTLNLLTNIVDGIELNVVDEVWPVEDLVKGLGIKGRPDIPEEYSTKKQPLKLQIPFSLNCKELQLFK